VATCFFSGDAVEVGQRCHADMEEPCSLPCSDYIDHEHEVDDLAGYFGFDKEATDE
jgi:hypothetical protein